MCFLAQSIGLASRAAVVDSRMAATAAGPDRPVAVVLDRPVAVGPDTLEVFEKAETSPAVIRWYIVGRKGWD